MNQPKMSLKQLLHELRTRKSDSINTEGVIEPFDMFAIALIKLRADVEGKSITLERIR